MLFESKQFLRDKVTHLEYRIKELEDKLCPCESHDWKQTGYRFVHIAMGELETVHRYKCKVCGKEKEDIF